MVPRKSARNPGCTRSDDSIVIPSDSESDFNDIEEATTITGTEPSRTTAKRPEKAPDLPSPLPLPKRRIQSQSTHDAPPKAAPPKPRHDPRFWYPDGNVVIRVGDTHFKLLRSRLAQQCRCFQELFSPRKESQPQASSSADAARVVAPSKKLDGCTVYKISGIDASDFTTFVTFLEYPVEHSVSTAPSDKLYALLRASDALGCDLICDLAKEAVAEQWPSFRPPEKGVYTRLNANSPQRVKDAIQAILHARKYRIIGVQKRAFYELLRNTAFWEAASSYTYKRTGSRREPPTQKESDLAAVRDMLALLSPNDLLRLQQARWEMRKAWDELVSTPPGSDKGWKERTCDMCPPAQNGQRRPDRAEAWALETLYARGYVEFDSDPIAGSYRMEDWLGQLKGHSRGKWCELCLDERQHMWDHARMAWWEKLDELFQTQGDQRLPGKRVVRVRRERQDDSDERPRKRLLI